MAVGLSSAVLALLPRSKCFLARARSSWLSPLVRGTRTGADHTSLCSLSLSLSLSFSLVRSPARGCWRAAWSGYYDRGAPRSVLGSGPIPSRRARGEVETLWLKTRADPDPRRRDELLFTPPPRPPPAPPATASSSAIPAPTKQTCWNIDASRRGKRQASRDSTAALHPATPHLQILRLQLSVDIYNKACPAIQNGGASCNSRRSREGSTSSLCSAQFRRARSHRAARSPLLSHLISSSSPLLRSALHAPPLVGEQRHWLESSGSYHAFHALLLHKPRPRQSNQIARLLVRLRQPHPQPRCKQQQTPLCSKTSTRGDDA